MADVAPEIVERGHGHLLVKYELGDGSTGLPFQPPAGYRLQSIHIFGDFDGAGVVSIMGSNTPSGAPLEELVDTDGDPVTFDEDTIMFFSDLQALYFALSTTTDGSTSGVDVDAYLLFAQRT